MIMHPSLHRSSPHCHYLRQAVVAPASYSPTPLDVTNASRMTLLTGMCSSYMEASSYFPRRHSGPSVALPAYASTLHFYIDIYAPFLHRLAVHLCISRILFQNGACCMSCKSHCTLSFPSLLLQARGISRAFDVNFNSKSMVHVARFGVRLDLEWPVD
jgi:hypothetical protein